jgi:carbon monoxide dehydrogenase subunit G
MPFLRVGCYRSSRICKSELAIALTEAVATTNLRYSSDAEAGVLAEYVAALVTVDDTDANVQRTLIESLEDFLGIQSKRT